MRANLADACRSCSALVAVVLVLAVVVLVLILMILTILVFLLVLILVLRHEAHLLSGVQKLFCAEKGRIFPKTKRKKRKNLQKGVDKAD